MFRVSLLHAYRKNRVFVAAVSPSASNPLRLFRDPLPPVRGLVVLPPPRPRLVNHFLVFCRLSYLYNGRRWSPSAENARLRYNHSMLQATEKIWYNGRLIPWDDAKI